MGDIMARPAWFVEIIKKNFNRHFAIGKMMKVPLIGPLIKKLFFGGDDVIFLPKDQVVTVNQHVPH
jgi:hypothetical protein